MVRLTALLLTVLTGISALVYEVAWQKYFATLLGSHSEATAAILAIFLGGLSTGYALFGRVTRRLVERARATRGPARLLLAYGLVEAGIGVYALAFPTLFGIAQRVSLLVPPGHPGLGFGFDVVLAALLIGPATVLMGGTIPILTLALAGDLEHATRVHAWVYGFNSVGAFVGALLGGFWIVPSLGLDGTLYAMGCVNLAAGILFAALDPRASAVSPQLAPAGEPAGSVPHFAAWAAVALLAGFAMMAIQTAFNRIGALAFGASQFTFAMVVAVFVFCIALGSLAVSALPRVPRGLLVGSQCLLLLLLVLLHLGVPDAPFWAHVLRTLFRDTDAAFPVYYLVVFLALLAVLLVPIGLSGALLPLLFDRLRRDVGDLGSVAGRLYAWNTVGSLLGALLGGYVLLFWLDLHHVYRIALAAVAAGAAISIALTTRATPVVAGLAVLLPTAATLLLLPPWDRRRLTMGLFRERAPHATTYEGPGAFFARRPAVEILFYDDDPTSTVNVVEAPPRPGEDRLNRSIVVNGKSDGSLIGDYPTMALSALLPALLAERPERAFVVGWGTGVTVGELAALDATREIEVAEISKGVLDARPLFDPGNLQASKSPKVRVHRADAYRALLQSTGRYDLIVSEPSNPWVTGVEMLYSVEFLEAARSRLAPGGVYGQWFHTYEVDDESVELVLRTYAAVFPQVSVWFTFATDVLLIGFDRADRALDPEVLEERFRRPDFASGFARIGITRFPMLLAHELLPFGALHAAELSGPLHTLRHPILSYGAARAFFRGGPAALPRLARPESAAVGARNSLLRRWAGAEDGLLPESVLEDAAAEYCRSGRIAECATFFARWSHDHPGSPRLEEALAKARKASRNSNLLGDRSLELIARLYGGRDAGTSGDRRVLERARSTSERYLHHYHHASPFDREVLTTAWKRCRIDPCEDVRREYEQILGPLDGASLRAGASAGRRPDAR
jgi:predicted membrane-bound spermidine synthase